MKKFIGIMLTIAIMATVVSSFAFADSTETGLISDLTSGASVAADSSTGYTMTAYTAADGATMSYSGDTSTVTTLNGFGITTGVSTLPENTKYLKTTFKFKSNYAIQSFSIKGYGTSQGITSVYDKDITDFDTTSKKPLTAWGTTEHEITILYEATSSSYYFYDNGVLVGAELNITSATFAKVRFIPVAFSTNLSTSDVYKVSDVTVKAYNSTATMENMGLNTYQAKYNSESKSYTITQSIYSVGALRLNGTQTNVYAPYVAGYDAEGKLIFAKEFAFESGVKYIPSTTVSGVDEAAKLKIFFWSNDDTLKPYMPVAPISITE